MRPYRSKTSHDVLRHPTNQSKVTGRQRCLVKMRESGKKVEVTDGTIVTIQTTRYGLTIRRC